jgi:hypothetical protein
MLNQTGEQNHSGCAAASSGKMGRMREPRVASWPHGDHGSVRRQPRLFEDGGRHQANVLENIHLSRWNSSRRTVPWFFELDAPSCCFRTT